MKKKNKMKAPNKQGSQNEKKAPNKQRSSNKKKAPNKKGSLKKKNLLWWGGVLLTISGILGAGFGIYTVYKGILMVGADSGPYSSVLTNLNITQSQASTAVITVGSILLVYFLIVIALGVIGIFTWHRTFTKRTLFWTSLVIIGLDILFYFLGATDLWLLLVTGAAGLVYCVGVYKNFTPKLKQI